MKIAVLGGERYDDIRKIREFIFNIKQNADPYATIVTRGKRIGAEYWIKKYTLEFGLKYEEYNLASTNRTLYSGMGDNYYGKPYNYTHILHQYDLVVQNSDKICYFGGIKAKEKNYFEKKLDRFKKSVVYIN